MGGIVTIVLNGADIALEIVENMTTPLRHRGTDATDCARLSVIDLNGGLNV